MYGSEFGCGIDTGKECGGSVCEHNLKALRCAVFLLETTREGGGGDGALRKCINCIVDHLNVFKVSLYCLL